MGTVLYYVGHPGFMSKALIHKFTKHPDDEMIIIASHDSYSRGRDYSLICNKIIFFFEYFCNVCIGRSKEYIAQAITDRIDKLFLIHNINVNHLDEIYLVPHATDIFSIYCEHKGIFYNEFDIATDRMYYMYSLGNSPIHPERANFAQLERECGGLSGTGRHCKKRVRYHDSSFGPECGNEVERINYYEALTSLPDSIKNTIWEFHGNPAFPGEPFEILLMNCPSGNTMFGHEFHYTDAIVFYQSLVDYYINNELPVVIKPHPRDDHFDYRRHFKYCSYLDRAVPAEFFPLLQNISNIKRAYNVGSTSGDAATNSGYDCVDLGFDYYVFGKILHFVYAAFKIHDRINDSTNGFSFCGVPIEQVEKFKQYAVPEYKDVPVSDTISPGDVIVAHNFAGLDEPAKQCILEAVQADSDTAVIFTGNYNRDEIYAGNKSCISEIRLQRTVLAPDTLAYLDDDVLLVISRNDSVHERLSTLHYRKELRNTGIAITPLVKRLG